MANVKISELNTKSSPSTSATLVGVDNGETVQIPTSVFAKPADIPSIEGLASESYVDTKVAGIVNSAPEALDTLNELAKALGNDANFSTTISTEIGKKADKSTLSNVATSGSYNDLKDKPTIPSLEGYAKTSDLFSKDYNDLTNKPTIPSLEGYAKTSDIPSLEGYAKTSDLFSKDYNDLENKPTIPSLEGYAKTSDLFSKDYNDLTNKPTIPSLEGLASESYVDTKISNNNLALVVALESKVDKIAGKGLSTNDYTNEEKNKLAKLANVATSGSYNDLSDKPNLEDFASESYVDERVANLSPVVFNVETTTTLADLSMRLSSSDLLNKPVSLSFTGELDGYNGIILVEQYKDAASPAPHGTTTATCYNINFSLIDSYVKYVGISINEETTLISIFGNESIYKVDTITNHEAKLDEITQYILEHTAFTESVVTMLDTLTWGEF